MECNYRVKVILHSSTNGTNLGRRFRFWFLYRHAIDAYGELDLRGFRAFALLELLIEFQFADRLLNHLDAFGLVHLCAAQILKYQITGR